MKIEDLDLVYTEFCQKMTDLGESNSQLFLARFAMLAMTHFDDLGLVRGMIASAGEMEVPHV